MSVPQSALADAPARPVRAVLALGTNLGDRLAELQGGLDGLAGYEGVALQAVSPVFETPPVGGPEQPDYLNAVVQVSTSLAPLDLLAACQQVEADHGRVRLVRWGPRTLDIDVITYGDVATDPAPEPAAPPAGRLDLPHPRAHLRAFVLAPWAALDPQAALPVAGVTRPVADLLATADDRDEVRVRADLTLTLPQ